MKIKKKAAMATAVFVAAMNLSACAYGPPRERDDAQQTQKSSYDNAENQNVGADGQDSGRLSELIML